LTGVAARVYESATQHQGWPTIPTYSNRIVPLAWLAALVALPGSEVRAQGITVDGRLSPAQTLAGPNYAIDAGLGRQVGGNLFHSFGAFGLKAGETATFSGPPSVGNVIGRVTGGAASSINGGIKSTIPGANLYLVNPAGVVFGPNASVDVGGSFHASSADYLRMKDGARFGATNPDASTLSAAPPEAFGFLSAPQPVMVNGSNLQLKQGNTLGLVGGAVTISGGTLYAPGGTVHVASAAGPGEVPVDPRAGPAPTVARSGSVQVANGSTILVSGGGGGGSVFIHAGELSIAASAIEADNSGPGPAGVLSLHGDRVVAISGGATVRAFANGAGRGPDVNVGTAAGGTVTLGAATISTAASAAGDGGAVAISTGTLTLQNGALVVSRTANLGNGGPINVAADSVLLDGSGTSLISQTTGAGLVNAGGVPAPAGASGNIVLTGGTLTVQNNAVIEADTFGSGAGGSISVAMTGNVAVSIGAQILSKSDAASAPGPAAATGGSQGGDAGAVMLNAGALTLLRGGSIRSVASASGNAGDVALNVNGALTIDATDFGGFVNGVSSETVDGSSGSAGRVQVSAGSVSVLNGGFINANTHGTGAGGPVTVSTPGALLLDGHGGSDPEIGSSALGPQSGNAGPVTVSAGTVAVQGGAQIASLTHSQGQGGGVTVNAGALTLLRGGSIRGVAFASGNAGDVALNVNGALTIDATDFGGFVNGVSSETVDGSSGSAGRVQVSAGSVSVLNGGFINANTHGTGAGGSVTVSTPGALLLDGHGGSGTEIGASALGPQSGNAGSVEISAGSVSVLNGGLITSNTAGTGAGGTVVVGAPGGALLLDGRGDAGTAISADTLGPQSGAAGTVTINAASVAVQGGAQVAGSTNGPGQGGGVTVNTGTLTVSRGGSIVSPAFASGNAGRITLNVNGALTVDAADAGLFANGVSSEAGTGSSGAAGTVQVNAGSVSVLNGGFINSSTAGTGAGGSVLIMTPGTLLLNGRGNIGGPAEVSASTTKPQSGNAGNVEISAGSVSVLNGGVVTSNTAGTGTGTGGSVLVTAPGALLLDGRGDAGTAISADTTGPRSGAAGRVTINAGSVAVQGGAQVASSTAGTGQGGDVAVNTGALTLSRGGGIFSTTSASGNAGEIALNANGALTVDAADAGRLANGVSSEAGAESSGSAGRVQVSAGSVSVLNGGYINSSTAGTGAGGSVLVTTPGALLLDGRGSVGGPAEVSASANGRQSGAAGPVTIEAGSVSVLNGGVITSNTAGLGTGGTVLVMTPGALLLDGGGDASTAISARTTGPRSGAAGPVTINAGSVAVQGGAQVAGSTAGPGQGGDVRVAAVSTVRLSGPGPQIAATSTGAGAAGSITVAAPQLFLRDGAGISTAAQSANGGNITIGPGDLLYLQRSSITTSVNSAFGNGGNIAVDPRLVVLDRGAIQANAVGGDGGTVLVRADQLVQSAGSAITATSQLGVPGQIFITGPPLDLNGSLVVLASELRSAAALLREGCAVRGAAPRSSLVAAGRGGQRQGLEATLPALYFVHRPVRDGGRQVPETSATPARTSIEVSSRCG